MANNSFLPEDYIEKRAERRTNFLMITLFVVVMAAVIAAFIVSDRQRADEQKLHLRVAQQFEEAAKRLDQLDQLQGRKEAMVNKAKVTAALLERVPRSIVMSELINNMPEKLSLLEMHLSTRVLPKKTTAQTALDQAKQDHAKLGNKLGQTGSVEPDIAPTEVTVSLVGLAPTDMEVASYMSALGKSPLFGELNLAFSEETSVEEHALRRFRIEMLLTQDVDVQKIEPLMVKRDIKLNPMVNAAAVDAAKSKTAGKGTIDVRMVPGQVAPGTPAAAPVTPKTPAIPAVNR